MQKDKYSRQSFLGANSQKIISETTVCVVGLGGGGSHAVQQLAHVGFQNYVIYDPQRVDDNSNLTRLIGATEKDAEEKTLKVDIAKRLIYGLQPNAKVHAIDQKWQKSPELLRSSDLIIGCLDGFSQRRELEATARRYLVPLVDLGMDVHIIGDHPPRMGGQVILSMPGGPCMFCLGFLTEKRLAQEAERYGDAGINPQVVWANGTLASAAVGIVIDLLTDWTRSLREPVYLEYDGNKGTLSTPQRMQYLKSITCEHYPNTEVGDPIFD
jgi:hypothetical protein